MATVDLKALAEPFFEEDLEWRIGRAGLYNDKPWAQVLVYVTNRAVMERLDTVCGPENWKNEYKEGPQGGVLCGISVRIHGEWITKWDGAENTQVESIKGGLSDAVKRAAVQWGIGRYLYNGGNSFAAFVLKSENKVKIEQKTYYWNPPKLKPEFLPIPKEAKPFQYKVPEPPKAA